MSITFTEWKRTTETETGVNATTTTTVAIKTDCFAIWNQRKNVQTILPLGKKKRKYKNKIHKYSYLISLFCMRRKYLQMKHYAYAGYLMWYNPWIEVAYASHTQLSMSQIVLTALRNNCDNSRILFHLSFHFSTSIVCFFCFNCRSTNHHHSIRRRTVFRQSNESIFARA